MSAPLRLVGIDPGLVNTGLAAIEVTPSGWRLVETAVAHTNAGQPLVRRLATIHSSVVAFVRRHQPGTVAVESLFFAKNVRSAVLMAHARGVALVAVSECGAELAEYSPLEIKQSVVGKGRAGKDQVARMVQVILALKSLPRTDHETDATACALAHAYRSRVPGLINAARESRTEQPTPARIILEQSLRGRRRRR